MKKEDIEYLKSLQHEMLTQDTVCQANPRFWVVMQEVREYWVDDNTDGIFIYSPDDTETAFEGELEELTDWIRELDGVTNCKYDVFFVEFNYDNEKYAISNAEDLQDFLNEYNKYNGGANYSVGYYRDRDEIAQNTMFLTLRECKEHIKANKHHYNKPRSYAMTAWRSPQVEKLYKILENTNWDNIQ